MLKPASEMSQSEINAFCKAASAAYFAIARAHAMRCGLPVLLPELLCPVDALPDVEGFDDETLDEAERFLVRLGVIGEGRPR